MLEQVLSIFLILITYAFFKLYYLPKKSYLWYSKTLKDLGYKVYQIPFQPLGYPWMEGMSKYEKEKGDSLYPEKHLYAGHDIVLSNILGTTSVAFCNPKLIKQLLDPQRLYKIPKMELGLSIFRLIGGRGLVLTEDEEWKRKRKLMSKLFNFDFLKGLIPLISKICDKVYDQVEQESLKHQPGDKISCNLFETSINIFALVITSGFFGSESIDSKIDGIPVHSFAIDLVNDAFKISADPLILLFGKRIYQLGIRKSYRQLEVNRKLLNQAALNFIKDKYYQYRKKSDLQRQKCLTIIQSIIHEKEKQGLQFGYDNQQIIHQFITFIVAGSETTGNYLTMIILYVFQFPNVQKRLREVINQHIKCQQDINIENLKKLEYIDWIQHETTRMFGPSISLFQRISSVDQFIADIPIKKGISVNYYNVPLHYDSRNYSSPYEFRPQRWEKECLSNNQFSLVGFSSGPRNCIGRHLALLESKIALIKFIRRYASLEQNISKRVFAYTLMAHVKDSKVTLTKFK